MPLILEREQVLDIYAEAAERKWLLPAFNTENRTSTEAILAAAWEYGQAAGHPGLPIIIGLTNTYSSRPQSVYYTQSRDWKIGLRLFLNDLEVLTSEDCPWAGLRVMVHLDHIQWDADEELTSPETAQHFFSDTGVDIVVANLGTEHRADAAERKYHGKLARRIKELIGPMLCLHGTSSVPPEEIKGLFDDGVIKVNIWTSLERDSAPALFHDMLGNAAKVAGSENVRSWINEGLLGAGAEDDGPAAVTHCTTTYRQEIVFREMKNIVRNFLGLWYV